MQENINTWLSEINAHHKTALSVDCVIFGYDESDLKVLLIECNMPPYEGKYSFVGAVMNPEESLDMAASRILKERTGLENVFLKQFHTFGDLNRHPLGRVVTVAYYSLIQIADYNPVDIQSRHLQWVSINEIKDLAFDHNTILDFAVNRLKKELRESPIGFNLLPAKFTLKQLQNLYEVVMGITLDKRNFRRKLLSLDILLDLKESQTSVAHRPAKLYSFDYKSYEQKINNGFHFEI